MKLFVWDFHGTLEKGNEQAAIEFSNIALKDFGFKERFTPEHVELLYGRKWYQYFEYLLPDHPKEVHLKLQEYCFGLNDTHWFVVEKCVKPNDASIDVLRMIGRNHDQILISNTSQKALEKFIAIVGMQEFFPKGKAFGVDGHMGTGSSKKEVLSKYLSDKTFEEIVVVGDSAGDVGLLRRGEGKRFLYMHSGKMHRDVEADFKIFDLREVLKAA